ncbi:MAG: ABC transporter ATP-binding protein [Anaerolineae bacterium]
MSVIEFANVSKRFTLQMDRPRSFQDMLLHVLRRRRSGQEEEVFWALKDVSFTLQAGEMVGLMGSNGAGKSTCLKLLARILVPTSGEVHVSGRVSSLLELGAGFHPELTGRENVFLHGSVMGLRRRQVIQRFDEIVAFAELERFIDMPVKFYSSGMYVRLAFSAAVHVDPEILLVDEVLAVGDQAFQNKCLDRIRELKARGVTVVLVSHNLDVIRNLCDRAIWLDGGTLYEDGVTDAVAARYLEQVYEKEEAAARAARPATPSPASGLIATPDGLEASLMRDCSRFGTREAEIIDVRFLDGQGEDRLLLTTGEPMTVVIRYRAHVRVDAPQFGLAIHSSSGVHICGPNSGFGGLDIPAIEGEGEVRYTIPCLPLLAGTFLVTVTVRDRTGAHAYDHQALAYKFIVQPGAIAERYGVIYIPASWEHLGYQSVEASDA